MNLYERMLEREREEKRAQSGQYSQRVLKLEGGGIAVTISISFDELFNGEA